MTMRALLQKLWAVSAHTQKLVKAVEDGATETTECVPFPLCDIYVKISAA